MPPDTAKVQQIAEKAQMLGELKKHPGWSLLREIFNKKQKTYFESLARKIMSGSIDAPTLDQRELDYQRGFWAGARWILDNPEQAERSLETALKRVQIYEEM